MCSPIPTRANTIQTERKYCRLRRLYEEGLSKDRRTRVPTNSLIAEIFVSNGTVGHERVSLNGDSFGL